MADEEITLKVVIVGDGTVGKSALLWAYMHQEFKGDYVPTVVDTFRLTMALEERTIKLEVFDTAGQENFKEIRKVNMTGTDVVLICYSCNNKDTLDNVKASWLKEIREDGKTFPFILVGNKSDTYETGNADHVTEADAKRVAKAEKAFTSMRCSALQWAETNRMKGEVDDVFNAAIKLGLLERGIIEPEGGCSCTIL